MLVVWITVFICQYSPLRNLPTYFVAEQITIGLVAIAKVVEIFGYGDPVAGWKNRLRIFLLG